MSHMFFSHTVNCELSFESMLEVDMPRKHELTFKYSCIVLQIRRFHYFWNAHLGLQKFCVNYVLHGAYVCIQLVTLRRSFAVVPVNVSRCVRAVMGKVIAWTAATSSIVVRYSFFCISLIF